MIGLNPAVGAVRFGNVSIRKEDLTDPLPVPVLPEEARKMGFQPEDLDMLVLPRGQVAFRQTGRGDEVQILDDDAELRLVYADDIDSQDAQPLRDAQQTIQKLMTEPPAEGGITTELQEQFTQAWAAANTARTAILAKLAKQ